MPFTICKGLNRRRRGSSLYIITNRCNKILFRKMSCTLWKCCTIIVLTSTVVLAIATVLGMWLGQKGALCPIDSASSLLIFPVCLNMEDVTLESLLTGNHRAQIIDLLRKHVKDDQV